MPLEEPPISMTEPIHDLDEHDVCDAIVIGAGAAGLAAGRAFAARGLRVELLEARSIVGGRAQSIDVPGLALPIELGPEFVHGTPEVTLALLREFGLAHVSTSDEAWTSDGGTLRPVGDEGGFSAANDLLRRCAAELAPEADTTVDEALAATSRPEDAAAVRSARALVAGFDAADLSRASVRAVAAEWAGNASASNGESRVVGGYRAFFAAFARSLDPAFVRLRLRTIVREIAWGPGDVRVTATGVDGTDRIVHAPRCVVTLPIGVLADDSVQFRPRLPGGTREAFDLLAPGPVLKALLVFRSAWWERLEAGRYRDGAFFSAPETAAFNTYWTQLPIRTPTLTAWAGGSKALPLAGFGESELVARALADLGAVFGEAARAIARDELVSAHLHDWQRDPFSRGAYSYALVGAGDARERLAQPIAGTLALAGEAPTTIAEAGTIAGALSSGSRAVARLLDGERR